MNPADLQKEFLKEMAPKKKQRFSLGPAYITLFVVLGVVALLTLMVTKVHVTIVLALVVVGFMVVAFFSWPEQGTLLVIFVIYTNIAVVAYKFHGLPQIVAGSVSLMLCVPLTIYWFIRRERFIIDYTWLLMIAFLASLFASLSVAVSVKVGMDWILTYLMEGLAMYILILNVVRNFDTLRKVIWTLLLAGTLLGSLTLVQELTKSYGDNYGGLAQRNISHWDGGPKNTGPEDKVRLANRAGGPVGGANRYGQIMIVLLPLGLFRFIDEKKKWLKVTALGCTLFILVGMLLTYSRGAFISVIFLVLMMTMLRYIKVSQLVLSVVSLLIVIAIASPGYFLRMSSITNVSALFTDDASVKADGATLGRVTEMLAAFTAYLDHPIVGVGPGQYSKFYSVQYMANPEIAFRDIDSTRRAHTLYFEMLAEAGTLGFVCFMSIVFYLLYRLWRLRVRFVGEGRQELANVATAFLLGIFCYLTTAMFLHFSYQRYLWILLAISGAAVHILSTEFESEDGDIEIETGGAHPFVSHKTPLTQ